MRGENLLPFSAGFDSILVTPCHQNIDRVSNLAGPARCMETICINKQTNPSLTCCFTKRIFLKGNPSVIYRAIYSTTARVPLLRPMGWMLAAHLAGAQAQRVTAAQQEPDKGSEWPQAEGWALCVVLSMLAQPRPTPCAGSPPRCLAEKTNLPAAGLQGTGAH